MCFNCCYFISLSSDSTVADVAVVLTLEDWGAITQKVTVPGENSQVCHLLQHHSLTVHIIMGPT